MISVSTKQVSEQNTETASASAALRREKARLRLIGIVVLLLGLGIAGIVYWHGQRAEDARLEEFEQSQIRAESRQMQMLYGTSGGVMEDLLNDLKQPKNKALAIAIISGLIAAGCFYLGRPLPEGDETH